MEKKPTLALIPSAYKAGKVYSVLPADGTGDFDNFSRGTTATRINKDGLIETVDSNVPRLNYPMIDGVVSGCPSLLLEPERINKIIYSEDLTKSNWFKIRSIVSASEIISPEGNSNAIIFKSNTSTSATSFYTAQDVSVTSGEDYTNSVFIKKGSSDFAYVQIVQRTSGYLGDASVVFQFSTETLGSISTSGTVPTNLSAKVEKYPNGWYRLSLFGTISGATTINRFAVGVCQSLTSIFYTATTNDSVYFWGAQAEQGFATSYIPSLTGSQATRSAETCNGAGDANTFNDSEGVLFAEVNFENNDTDKGISISDGTSSNRVLFYLSTNGNLYGYVFNGNGSIPIVNMINTNFQINLTAKLAIKYKQNDFSFWVNGYEIGTETSGNTFSSGVLDQLSFTSYGTSVNPFYGNVKQIQYFDTALNDTDLETLTSWKSFSEMARDLLYTIE
jgi:hypothetical protein